MGVVFIGGVYGVGKTMLSKEISAKYKIPFYNASDLISKQINEDYQFAKGVSNVDSNQTLLIKEVTSLLKNHSKLILNGHFCVLDMQDNIISLSEDIFQFLNIEKIVLLESEISILKQNLENRNNQMFNEEMLHKLAVVERNTAISVSKRFNLPLTIIKYNNSITDEVLFEFEGRKIE